MRARAIVRVWVVLMPMLVATTAVRWRRIDAPRAIPVVIPSVRADPISSGDAPLDSVASTIVAHDPFRLVNAPSRTRYGTSAQPVATSLPAAREARPAMTLKAIAGGPPWQALIDGVPGQTHAVLVQIGTALDRLSIRAITRDGVVVRGPDTTWVLSFAPPP